MLQQTQVATVIPYFERFIDRFPDIETLAAAPVDDVMHHWAGLGYYSRARNLHKAAQRMAADFQGCFPESYQDVLSLPGIGPSTAGAVLAQSMGQRHAILDGNVKRVLSRYHLVEGWPGKREVEKTLWHWAEVHTPDSDLADYTQAIMDLGATVCKRSSPECAICPVHDDCQAFCQGRVDELPHRKPQKSLPVKQKRLLIISDGERLLLEKRPPSGIWGGLWSLPEIGDEETPEAWCRRRLGAEPPAVERWETVQHSFTHYDLHMQPVLIRLEQRPGAARDADDERWIDVTGGGEVGVPAPVRRLLDRLGDLAA